MRSIYSYHKNLFCWFTKPTEVVAAQVAAQVAGIVVVVAVADFDNGDAGC